MKKEALSAILKWVALGFVSLLHLKSYKKEPKNISFNELFGVDDIILEFQDVSLVFCFKHYFLMASGILCLEID